MAGKQPRILSCKRTLVNAMKVPITKVHVSDIDSLQVYKVLLLYDQYHCYYI